MYMVNLQPFPAMSILLSRVSGIPCCLLVVDAVENLACRLLGFLDDGEALRESPVLDTDITLFERGHNLTICRLLTMLWGESFDRSSNLVLKLGGDLGRTHLDS